MQAALQGMGGKYCLGRLDIVAGVRAFKLRERGQFEKLS